MASARSVFTRELEELHRQLLYMGGIVEQQIAEGVASLVKKDGTAAEQVIKRDETVNELQNKVEDQCISLIVRQQPLATDLRRIFAAIKLATDLERISDLAVNIAQITISLIQEPYIKPLIDIPRMGEIAKKMTKQALDAYVQGSQELAEGLFQLEEEMDSLRDQVFRELLLIMMQEPKTVAQATYLLLVARHLERIGDHTTNIGEMVIYQATGERVKLN
jgi:phosphate transport system protein